MQVGNHILDPLLLGSLITFVVFELYRTPPDRFKACVLGVIIVAAAFRIVTAQARW